MIDLARILYKIAFEWLNERINEALDIHARTMVDLRVNAVRQTTVTKDPVKAVRLRLEPTHKITLLDFPGYTNEASLGAFSTNIAIEALNYYCSKNYVKLIGALDAAQIRIKHLEAPK